MQVNRVIKGEIGIDTVVGGEARFRSGKRPAVAETATGETGRNP